MVLVFQGLVVVTNNPAFPLALPHFVPLFLPWTDNNCPIYLYIYIYNVLYIYVYECYLLSSTGVGCDCYGYPLICPFPLPKHYSSCSFCRLFTLELHCVLYYITHYIHVMSCHSTYPFSSVNFWDCQRTRHTVFTRSAQLIVFWMCVSNASSTHVITHIRHIY